MHRFIRLRRLVSIPRQITSLVQIPVQRLTMSTSSPMATEVPKAAETDAQADAVTNATGVTAEGLQSTLRDKVGAQHVDIEDMSGACHSCLSTSPPSSSIFDY